MRLLFGVEGKEFVICKLCGRKMRFITNTHLRNRHDITCEEYRKLFPDALTHSQLHRELLSRQLRGRVFTEEHKRKISISTKRRWDPEQRKLQSERRKGSVPWNKGIRASVELRRKNSEGHKGLRASEKTREKRRLIAIRRIEEQYLNGEPLIPAVGKFERSCFDILEKTCSYTILRQYKVAGFFLDGYISERNFAIEFDEDDYHDSTIERDVRRQLIITEKLQCRFLRISKREWVSKPSVVVDRFSQVLKEN